MSTTTPAEQAKPQQQGPIVARAGKYYRNTRYIMCAVLIGMGAWFGYDGFKAWPELNERIAEVKRRQVAATDAAEKNRLGEELKKLGEPKSDTDILLQEILCFVLPPLGIVVLRRALHNSRGEYRLDEGNTLHVPGHPPVPFENITEVDRSKWDRKGIAYVDYDLGNGQQGTIKLDDFHYERPPTDEIFKRIEDFVTPQATAPAESPQEPQSEKDPQNSA
jgi:hypothetical protein